QAKQADAEIAAGKYKGPLHGIPWGAKDIISVKGYKTTWGSPAFKEQSFDYDASIVEMLREAGAVLIAKLATGELASGDQWFGGQTKSPWNLSQGPSGSSAGPSSATAAGCVASGVGILQPSFDELTNATVKKNAEHTLDTLRSIGVSKFIPVTVPDAPANVAALGVESIVFFDEYARAGKMKEARGGARPNGRLIPA